MTIVEKIQLITLAVQTAAFVALAIQLFLMNKQKIAHHERTRKQATLEIAGPQWAEARFALETKFGRDAIATKEAEDIFKDKELKAYVDRLLGTLEYISAGVNTGVYDADVLYRMCSTSVIDNFHRFQAYIKLRRLQESPEMYIELEAVVINFTKRRQKHPVQLGDIIHSAKSDAD